MSWDTTEKRIKCPCGKGEIVQVNKDNDWGQSIEGTPVIECPECAKKYRLVSKTHTSYKPGHGSWTNYYLVPKGIKPDKKYKSSFEYVNGYELAKKDFAEYLIVDYPKNVLEEVHAELLNATSVSALRSAASRIAKDKKRYTGSCKIKELTLLVKKAIDGFDSYNGNWQQRDDEEQENIKAEEEYFAKVRKEGILLDF